jgi:hypothetical protein
MNKLPTNSKIKIVISNPKMEAFLFDNFEEAQKSFPDISLFSTTKTFTSPMHDKHDGEPIVRFEDWETYRRMSI